MKPLVFLEIPGNVKVGDRPYWLVAWRTPVVRAVGDGAAIIADEEGERKYLSRATVASLIKVRD